MTELPPKFSRERRRKPVFSVDEISDGCLCWRGAGVAGVRPMFLVACVGRIMDAANTRKKEALGASVMRRIMAAAGIIQGASAQLPV